MKETTKLIFDNLFERYPCLADTKESVRVAFETIKECFEQGGVLYLAGNGGSATDCEHIAGELLKSFKKPRPIDEKIKESLKENSLLLENLEGALPAVVLTSQTGFLTAFANDKSWDCTVAQGLLALGRRGDVFLALSTSGNSKNLVLATDVAKAKGIKTVALTGSTGGKLREVSEVCVCAPEKETFKVQELHLPIYHTLCAMLEEEFF